MNLRKAPFRLFMVLGLGALLAQIPVDVWAQSAQNPAENWKKLMAISYRNGAPGELGLAMPQPVFSPQVRALDGKEVELTGFIIPFEGLFSPQHVMLSFMPVEICYFCGQSGPETVVEVFLLESIEYTKEPIRVRGRLELVEEPLETLMYVLRDAEYLGEYEPKH